jgi:hypothetical protein
VSVNWILTTVACGELSAVFRLSCEETFDFEEDSSERQTHGLVAEMFPQTPNIDISVSQQRAVFFTVSWIQFLNHEEIPNMEMKIEIEYTSLPLVLKPSTVIREN